jgi:hypothetical protein
MKLYFNTGDDGKGRHKNGSILLEYSQMVGEGGGGPAPGLSCSYIHRLLGAQRNRKYFGNKNVKVAFSDTFKLFYHDAKDVSEAGRACFYEILLIHFLLLISLCFFYTIVDTNIYVEIHLLISINATRTSEQLYV